MKVCVVADEDTVTGFRLAGVKVGHAVDTPEEAVEKIRELAQDKDVGIIIVTERIMEKIRGEVEAIIGERTFPLVVEVPDKGGKIEKKVDPLQELVRRAVGVEIKV